MPGQAPYLVFGIRVRYFKRGHGFNHILHGCDYVFDNDSVVTGLLPLGKRFAVDYLDLLEEGGLARLRDSCEPRSAIYQVIPGAHSEGGGGFSLTQKQHFDLLENGVVPFVEEVVYLPAANVLLRIAHAARHGGGIFYGCPPSPPWKPRRRVRTLLPPLRNAFPFSVSCQCYLVEEASLFVCLHVTLCGVGEND